MLGCFVRLCALQIFGVWLPLLFDTAAIRPQSVASGLDGMQCSCQTCCAGALLLLIV
jgi:hypothetical protein